VARSWEIVFAIPVRAPAVPTEGWECSEVRAVEHGAWPEPMADVARQMLPVVEAERRARG
jgi:hypothetical protein